MAEKRLPETLIRIIRNEVKNGKIKIQLAMEYGLSYYQVKKYTRDIQKKPNKHRMSPELIRRIRANVRKYNSKIRTARKMGISYRTVIRWTEDIPIKRGLSEELIKHIREEALKGKHKLHIAKDLGISTGTVDTYTKDIPVIRYQGGWPGIRGKTLHILKKLLIDGYYICSDRDINGYRTIKKYFPTIYKVNIHGCTMLFLQDKSNIAVKVFLETMKKKIMSYQELNQIIKIFDAKISKSDKQKFIYKS